jgi:hypothetical protein
VLRRHGLQLAEEAEEAAGGVGGVSDQAGVFGGEVFAWEGDCASGYQAGEYYSRECKDIRVI